MNTEEWKKKHAIHGDAIISVCEGGTASLIIMLTNEPWKIHAQDENDTVSECEFTAPPGLYYARCYGRFCGGYQCTCGVRDCYYIEWELCKPIYQFDIQGEE